MSALWPRLGATFLMHLQGARPRLTPEYFLRGGIAHCILIHPSFPVTSHWPPVWPNTQLQCEAIPEISSLQIRNANYVLSRGRVNKILKQWCLLRLNLQVPDGDYGTVQIVVRPEIGALLNYGSHGKPVGMWRIDRQVIPDCWESREGGGR